MRVEAQSQVSDELFKRITLDARHPKSIHAAERIRDACDYLSKHDLPISISGVAELCRQSGPRAQSIQNNPQFRAYVSARRSEQQLRFHPSSKHRKFRTDDPDTNVIIHALECEISLERGKKENLSKAFRAIGEYDLRSALETGKLVATGLGTAQAVDCIGLATCLLDPSHLRSFGLVIESDRILSLDRNNRVFLGKEHVQILRRLLAGAPGRPGRV